MRNRGNEQATRSSHHGELIAELEHGPLHEFARIAAAEISPGKAGVYTVWRGREFLYVGMSWQVATLERPSVKGLAGRLSSHASGRRSGDQFNIYICDRFVVPNLSSEELTGVGSGELSLDRMTREYIHQHLRFRFVLAESGAEARELELSIRKNGLPTSGAPFLNSA